MKRYIEGIKTFFKDFIIKKAEGYTKEKLDKVPSIVLPLRKEINNLKTIISVLTLAYFIAHKTEVFEIYKYDKTKILVHKKKDLEIYLPLYSNRIIYILTDIYKIATYEKKGKFTLQIDILFKNIVSEVLNHFDILD